MRISHTSIILRGLKFYAFHGVLPQEIKTGAEFTIDLKLYADFSEAAIADTLDHTVNYASVYEAVKQEMSVRSQLLEHVSWRIAHRLLADFPLIQTVEISLYKQNPPMGAECDQVGITAAYTRESEVN